MLRQICVTLRKQLKNIDKQKRHLPPPPQRYNNIDWSSVADTNNDIIFTLLRRSHTNQFCLVCERGVKNFGRLVATLVIGGARGDATKVDICFIKTISGTGDVNAHPINWPQFIGRMMKNARDSKCVAPRVKPKHRTWFKTSSSRESTFVEHMDRAYSLYKNRYRCDGVDIHHLVTLLFG